MQGQGVTAIFRSFIILSILPEVTFSLADKTFIHQDEVQEEEEEEEFPPQAMGHVTNLADVYVALLVWTRETRQTIIWKHSHVTN